MTFHWAANHGAILQTYALSHFLEKNYRASVQVIDYFPKQKEHTWINALKKLRPNAILQGFTEVKKDKKLRTFRKTLPLTKRFYSNAQLMSEDLDMDILITGSDQIWNPSFLRYGERGGTAVYYLNFGGDQVRRLAVSASFGCSTFPADCCNIIKPLLERFSAISVRENTGIDILHSLSIDGGSVTADPTALLSREEYLSMCNKSLSPAAGKVTKMILRRQSKEKKKLISRICSSLSEDPVCDMEFLSMSDWLTAIRDSKIVITNSFHCVMMCLQLHTPFVVIWESGERKGMNDRFVTLLNTFQLTDRIVENDCDIKKLSETIDFEKVDILMKEYSSTLESFIARHLGEADRIL